MAQSLLSTSIPTKWSGVDTFSYFSFSYYSGRMWGLVGLSRYTMQYSCVFVMVKKYFEKNELLIFYKFNFLSHGVVSLEV